MTAGLTGLVVTRRKIRGGQVIRAAIKNPIHRTGFSGVILIKNIFILIRNRI